jgi:hypothetical protein
MTQTQANGAYAGAYHRAEKRSHRKLENIPGSIKRPVEIKEAQ